MAETGTQAGFAHDDMGEVATRVPSVVDEAAAEVARTAPEAVEAQAEAAAEAQAGVAAVAAGTTEAAPEATDTPVAPLAELAEAAGDTAADVAAADEAEAARTPEAAAQMPEGNEPAPAPEGDPTQAPASDGPAPEAEADTLAQAGAETAPDSNPAREAVAVVAGGISAVREVSAAKRAHAEARALLAQTELRLKDEQAQLAHRQEIEANYDDIIKVQGAEAQDAANALSEAQQREASLTGERDARTSELERLRADNERRLAPHKELMESAKGALSDAESAQSEAKRALKSAQQQADTAANTRDSRLAAANRAVDNAASRHQRLQEQLDALKRDDTTGAKELSEMTGAVTAALAQLENAKEDVKRITTETTQGVENAQTHLYTQRKSLEEAESDLAAAKAEEQRRREEYEGLRAEADKAEKALQDKVEELGQGIAKAQEDQQAATGRAEAAQVMIQEAEDIHATPDATRSLAAQIESDENQAEVQRQELERRATELHDTRERTQGSRRTLYLIAAAVVVVLLLVIWLVFFNK